MKRFFSLAFSKIRSKWVFSVVGVLLLLTIPMMGCIEDTESKKTQAPVIVTVTDQQQNTKIESVEKKNSDQDTKISELTGKVAAIPAQGASQAAIDAANAKISNLESAKAQLESRIAALETWKTSQGTTTTPGSTLPVPITGQITVTTNPTAIQILGGSQLCYTMRITNGTSTWQYVKPILTLNTTTSTSVSAVNLAMSWGSFNMVNTPTVTCWQFTPLAPTLTNSVLCIPIACGATNLGEIQLSAGGYVDILVCLTITSTPQAIWTISTSISNRSI